MALFASSKGSEGSSSHFQQGLWRLRAGEVTAHPARQSSHVPPSRWSGVGLTVRADLDGQCGCGVAYHSPGLFSLTSHPAPCVTPRWPGCWSDCAGRRGGQRVQNTLHLKLRVFISIYKQMNKPQCIDRDFITVSILSSSSPHCIQRNPPNADVLVFYAKLKNFCPGQVLALPCLGFGYCSTCRVRAMYGSVLCFSVRGRGQAAKK
jgi:hypothetical protein